jgi:hypothetical protein
VKMLNRFSREKTIRGAVRKEFGLQICLMLGRYDEEG